MSSYIDPGVPGHPVSLLEGHAAVHVVEGVLVVLPDGHGPAHTHTERRKTALSSLLFFGNFQSCPRKYHF